MFGASNIFLYLTSIDYFGESNTLNPLMHTWSLGVEEQFYLIYPILLFWILRRPRDDRRILIVILGVATILSSIAFAYLFHTSQSIAYYLTPFRVWELGIGYLLALNIENLRIRTSLLFQNISLASIVAAFVIGDTSPILTSFLAVGGSAGLILTGAQESSLNRLMLKRPVQYLGRLSYSLYLWHWLIICLAIWTVGINWITIPFIVILSFGLASLSFHFLEEPARRLRWLSQPVLNIGTGVSLMISVALLIVIMNKTNTPHFTGTHIAAVARTGYKPDDKTLKLNSRRSIKNCLGKNIANDQEAASIAIKACKADSPLGPRLFFFGDSHSYDMFGVSEVLFDNKAATVINFGQEGCRTPRLSNELDYCNYPETIMNTMPPLRRGQRGYVVIRSNYTPKYIGGSLRDYEQRIESLYERMRQLGYGLIYVAPAPKFPTLVAGGLCTKQWYRPVWSLSEGCATGASVSRTEQLGRRKEFFESLKGIESKYQSFYVYDPFDALCGTRDDICTATKDGMPLFRDQSHLTTAGAGVMGMDFFRFMCSKEIIPGSKCLSGKTENRPKSENSGSVFLQPPSGVSKRLD